MGLFKRILLPDGLFPENLCSRTANWVRGFFQLKPCVRDFEEFQSRVCGNMSAEQASRKLQIQALVVFGICGLFMYGLASNWEGRLLQYLAFTSSLGLFVLSALVYGWWLWMLKKGVYLSFTQWLVHWHRR